MVGLEQGERVRMLDGWRGVAVLCVIAGHFLPYFGIGGPLWSANFGRVGVELFFALSGVLMGGILFSRRMPLVEFAARRFARIVPSMWLFTLVATAMMVARGGDVGRGWLYAVVGVGNLFPSPGELNHLWSVCLELQGYVLLGLTAALCRATGLAPAAVLLSIIGASWLLCMTTGTDSNVYYTLYWRPEYRLTAMLTGACLIERHSAQAIDLAKLRPWPVLLLTGALLQLNAVPDAVKYTAGSACLAVACACMASTAHAPRVLHAVLSHRWVVAFGAASYSIYLWQQLIYAGRWHANWPTRLLVAVMLGFAAHHLWDHWLHRFVAKRLTAMLLGRRDAQGSRLL